MLAKERIWEIREYDKHKAGCLAAELGISPLVTGILLERGLNDTESMREFLYGSLTPFHDPFLLKDMEKAVRRMEKALAAEKKSLSMVIMMWMVLVLPPCSIFICRRGELTCKPIFRNVRARAMA